MCTLVFILSLVAFDCEAPKQFRQNVEIQLGN